MFSKPAHLRAGGLQAERTLPEGIDRPGKPQPCRSFLQAQPGPGFGHRPAVKPGRLLLTDGDIIGLDGTEPGDSPETIDKRSSGQL